MKDKRTMILTAAIDLFARDGFWNTSTASIAKHAGVATGTLFNHFASKDALINELYAELKLDSLAAVSEGLSEIGNLKRFVAKDLRMFMAEAWRRHVRWALANPVRSQLLEQLRLSELISSETKTAVAKEFAFFENLIVNAIADGKLVDLPVPLHFEIFKSQINGTVGYLTSAEASDGERDAIIDQAFAVYWKGVSP